MNHIDELKAAPIHVAVRKKQYQAIRDCIEINKQRGKQVFNFNLYDKKGFTPLHYAVDKHDYEMFLALLEDPYLDILKLDDTDLCMKPRRQTVIFSAFHKILYLFEKLAMRKLFQKTLMKDYISFNRFH